MTGSINELGGFYWNRIKFVGVLNSFLMRYLILKTKILFGTSILLACSYLIIAALNNVPAPDREPDARVQSVSEADFQATPRTRVDERSDNQGIHELFPTNQPNEIAPEEVIIEYGDFVHVKEYRRECTKRINVIGAGRSELVETCERRFEFDHSYSGFTDTQLAQIAKTDGQAAYLLAHRKLIDPAPGQSQDIEGGLNDLMSAIIRGGGQQAFSLLLDESVFSPYRDLDSFFLWSYVGSELGLLTEEQDNRHRMFSAGTSNTDHAYIRNEAKKIADLLRSQRLIVMGTEF